VGGVLRDALLFDIYRPKSPTTFAGQTPEKSMAVRLTLNATEEAALTEAQIDATVAAVVATLAERLGARQRT
jgi:phenylalanyl-tRNA synthetase beta chain